MAITRDRLGRFASGATYAKSVPYNNAKKGDPKPKALGSFAKGYKNLKNGTRQMLNESRAFSLKSKEERDAMVAGKKEFRKTMQRIRKAMRKS